MEVILLKPNRNLGKLGDKVKVKAGYGRNYLIPHGQAVPATPDNIEHFEKSRSELEATASGELAEAEKRLESLQALKVTIAMKAGDEGKLFGSVGTRDIAEAITQAGVAVKKKEVLLPEGTLRQIGEFEVTIQVHTEVLGTINIAIVPV